MARRWELRIETTAETGAEPVRKNRHFMTLTPKEAINKSLSMAILDVLQRELRKETVFLRIHLLATIELSVAPPAGPSSNDSDSLPLS